MNLSARIFSGFGAVIAIQVIASLFVFNRVSTAKRGMHRIQVESLPVAGVAWQLRLDTVQVQQWLTDVSATRGLDGLNDGFDVAARHAAAFHAGIATLMESYGARGAEDRVTELRAIDAAFAAYYEAGREMAQAYVAEGPAGGNRLMAAFDATASALSDRLTPFVEGEWEAAKAEVGAEAFLINQLFWGVALACGLATLVGLLLSWRTVRAIGRPINQAVENLDEQIVQLTGASRDIERASHQLADASSHQAATIEEIAASLEELRATIQANADNTGQARALADSSRGVVDRSRAVVAGMIKAMDEISDTGDKTQRIVSSIDEIAFQTNILALNAAVEAARAGEAGAGFAVVASEVRQLAARAARAASDAAELIEASNRQIGEGGRYAQSTGEAFGEISGNADRINALMGEIATASREQAEGVQQLSSAVQEIERTVQDNTHQAGEASESAHRLTDFAGAVEAAASGLQRLTRGQASPDRAAGAAAARTATRSTVRQPAARQRELASRA